MKTFYWLIALLVAAAIAVIVTNSAHASVLGSLADAACGNPVTVIVPAAPTTQCVMLTNSGANAARVGDANCGAARCAQLTANGPAMVMCTQGPISCFSAAGTTINITLLNGPQ